VTRTSTSAPTTVAAQYFVLSVGSRSTTTPPSKIGARVACAKAGATPARETAIRIAHGHRLSMDVLKS
jgi:hypothetical protein